MSGVEFLPEAGGDDPPDLAEPDVRPPRQPLFSRAVRIAVVVVAAAGLAGWVATRPSDPSPRTQPQAAVTSPTPAAPSRPESSVPTWSTTTVRCSLGAPVRRDVARAMHRYLRGISITTALAGRCVTGSDDHPKIVSESVVGRYRKISVEVALSRRDSEFATSYELIPASHRTIELGGVETESAGIKIRITSSGDGRTMPPRFHIQQLADYLSLNTVL
jgi:hypothetical protein